MSTTRKPATYTRTVKLKVDSDMMDDRTGTRLREMMRRDSEIIDRIIKIIKSEEQQLMVTSKHGKMRIDRSKLHRLIYSTDSRQVKYDLKQEFSIDANSLIECRRSAEWMYNSYLVLEQKEEHRSRQPRVSGLIPRSINQRRFEIMQRDGTNWLGIIDSLDGTTNGCYPRLYLPLVMYDYGEMLIETGKPAELQIVRESYHWYIHLRLRYDVTESKQPADDDREVAMVGIDLGISKMMVCSVLTRDGVIESKVFHDEQQLRRWRKKEQMRKDLLERIQQRQELEQRLEKLNSFRSIIGTIHRLTPRDIEYSDPYRDLMDAISQLDTVIQKIQSGTIPEAGTDDHTKIITMVSLFRHQLNEFLPVLRTWERMQHRSLDQLQETIMELAELVVIIDDTIATGFSSGVSTSTKALQRKLNKTRNKVHNIKLDIDRQLVAKLVTYLESLQQSYRVYIFVGDLKDIVYVRAGRWLKKQLRRWSYGRITDMIEEKTYELGLHDRFFRVHEFYTSAKCHRCRKTGVRPKQSVFFCSYEYCGWRGNADINGSINIAKQGIYYLKMRDKFANSRIENWLAPRSS